MDFSVIATLVSSGLIVNQKSISVTPTPVKMVEHAKNKEALTNASVPQSFKEVTVQKRNHPDDFPAR